MFTHRRQTVRNKIVRSGGAQIELSGLNSARRIRRKQPDVLHSLNSERVGLHNESDACCHTEVHGGNIIQPYESLKGQENKNKPAGIGAVASALTRVRDR